jgi:hypothetical protein
MICATSQLQAEKLIMLVLNGAKVIFFANHPDRWNHQI